MATPSLTAVNNFLVSESGRIQSEMSRQSRARGYKWDALIKKSSFPLGMGETLSKVNYERSTLTTDSGWNQISLNPTSGSASNNATITTDDIASASTTLTFSLYSRGINSSPVSLHDANLSLNFSDQLNSVVYNLEQEVMDIWEDRYQDEYDRLCGHKVICETTNGDNPTETGSDQAWAAEAPTSQITLEFLEYAYDSLLRDGGADGLDTVQGDPCPLIICSPEAKRTIFRNNTELSKNIRYSSESDLLLNPLGATTAYGNMKFVTNVRAPRYDYSTGTWTRRSFYSTSAATIGTKANPSTLYKNAAYETLYMFHPNVFEMMMYDPDTSYNNGVEFEASNWMGKFKWVNDYDKTSNPDRHTGFFRALLGAASRPGLTNLGYAFRYLRCPGRNFNAVACPTT